MLALFETLFNIIRLRKGPDALPYSWLLCLMVLTLWLISGLAMTVMTEELGKQDFLLGTFTGVVGLACYASIVVLTGHVPRLLQTVTAVLGCGAALSFLFIACNVFLAPFLSANLARLIATLVLLWSIPVEGHIIARSIDRHWYLGIVMAMTVFVFQMFLYSLLDPTAQTAN